jgi:uncharacterized protein YebE (UPF0316 family)
MTDWPVWALALLIYCLRVCDVSLGTLRSLSVVQGRTGVAACLGFVEVMLWVTAVSPTIARLGTEPILAVAYAGGFASGNAMGVFLERKLALGNVVVRIFSPQGLDIAKQLRARGHVLTTFDGEGRDGRVTLLYVTCARELSSEIIEVALSHDATAFYSVERSSGGRHGRTRDGRGFGSWWNSGVRK